MRLLEEEPRFNLTLLELLRNDFALTINGLDGELPTDESGIDVDGIWNLVRRAVRDIPGFEVSRDVVIGTFSFAKYLMWKDLVDRSPQLMESPLVKYLIERGKENVVLEKSGEVISVEQLDNAVNTQDLFLPLPADSSQIAAVVASAKGRDFVLDGPPGTGKSQTIANMIAHNLALGRRVLFVAEKKAALDVVYRRLESQGLGEFCLELHSSKTSKMDFLKQLERAWDTRDMLTAGEWQEETSKVQNLRDKLNEVVRLLHLRWPNGFSLHQAMGRVIKDATEATPHFTWPANTLHSLEQMEQFRQIAKRLELNRTASKQHGDHFALIAQTDWTNAWQSSLVAEAKTLPGSIDELEHAADELFQATGIMPGSKEPTKLKQLTSFCELLSKAGGMNLSFMFAPNATDLVESAHTAISILRELETVKARLSVDYPGDSWQYADVQQIRNALELAEKKFWFLATRARKQVIAGVITQHSLNSTPNLSTDLPIIVMLQSLLQRLSDLNAMTTALPGWEGINTDVIKLQSTLAIAEDIRNRLGTFASTPQQLAEIRKAIKTLLIDSNDLLGPQGIVAALTQNLRTALSELTEAKVRFCQLIKPSEENLSLSQCGIVH